MSESEKWHKQTFKIPPELNLEHLAKPGYQIFIADRGAVAFSYPRGWVILPAKNSIKLHDRTPPDDECVMEVSVMRLPPIQGGWDKVPLEMLLRQTFKQDRRKKTTIVGDMRVEKRPEMELAWSELRFVDEKEKRPARSRCCLSRANFVQPLITMDFWESDIAQFGPVWDEVIRSLKVGLQLAPPAPPPGLN